jgi:hypothetical protein
METNLVFVDFGLIQYLLHHKRLAMRYTWRNYNLKLYSGLDRLQVEVLEGRITNILLSVRKFIAKYVTLLSLRRLDLLEVQRLFFVLGSHSK